jgi:hypothetical protein
MVALTQSRFPSTSTAITNTNEHNNDDELDISSRDKGDAKVVDGRDERNSRCGKVTEWNNVGACVERFGI